MPTVNKAFFRRPRTAKEIGDSNLSVQVSRAVKDGTLLKNGTVFYYRSGWFERLEDKWETKDLFLHYLLLFSRLHEVVSKAKQLESMPTSLRKVTAQLRKIAEELLNHADELDRRADLLALEEESKTEAAD